MMENVLKEIRKKVSYPVSIREVEKVLYSVSLSSDFWKIVRFSSNHILLVSNILKTLADHGFIQISNGSITLTDLGRGYLAERGIGFGDHICKTCRGRTIVLDNFLDVLKDFKNIVENRPKPIQEFDQGYVTPECTVARIAFMDQKGDLRGREFIILGDDDLVSIAAALTGLPRRIVVLEVDERIISFIEKVSREYGFDIDVRRHDLRNPLPDDLVGKFDTFFTDPPEAFYGLKIFIGRGITALKGFRSVGYFGLTMAESTILKWYRLQSVLINEYKVVITDVVRDFNEYLNWGYLENMEIWRKIFLKKKPKDIWYTSTLFRFELLEESKGFDKAVGEEIYYDDERGLF